MKKKNKTAATLVADSDDEEYKANHTHTHTHVSNGVKIFLLQWWATTTSNRRGSIFRAYSMVRVNLLIGRMI